MHSDWGRWLPDAVQAADPDGVRIWYLGCNGFIVKAADSTTVFIDPYLGTGDPPRTVRMIPVPFAPEDVQEADAVLATHDHTDHVHGPSQAPIIAGTDAVFYGADPAVETATEWSREYAVDNDDIQTVVEGEVFDVGSLTISVEPAYDPDATQPVSFVIEHAAGTFFHGGDARPSDAFESIGARHDIDLGALAFGSAGMIRDKQTRTPTYTQWYSDENMVVEAAVQLQLKRLVPTHWDMWKGLTADPSALRHHIRSFPYPESVTVLEIGDSTLLADSR